jgi:hypothetical protein
MPASHRILGLLLAALALPAAGAEVPLADFARHEQFRDIKISPQGDYVAASAVVDGRTVLSLIRLACSTASAPRSAASNSRRSPASCSASTPTAPTSG